jgi:hypothetical protein
MSHWCPLCALHYITWCRYADLAALIDWRKVPTGASYSRRDSHDHACASRTTRSNRSTSSSYLVGMRCLSRNGPVWAEYALFFGTHRPRLETLSPREGYTYRACRDIVSASERYTTLSHCHCCPVWCRYADLAALIDPGKPAKSDRTSYSGRTRFTITQLGVGTTDQADQQVPRRRSTRPRSQMAKTTIFVRCIPKIAHCLSNQ